MFNKRGVDAVVATVLIIMITVAAVAVIWLTIIPMIKTSLSSSTEAKAVLTIETDAGYTTWDEATKTLRVQVKRGADEANLTGIQFIFTNSTGSITNISGTIEKGLAKVYTFENLLTTKPIKVAIAPMTAKGIGEVVSETTLIGDYAGLPPQKKLLGETCSVGEDCESEVCGTTDHSNSVCTNGLSDNDFCNVDNDCASPNSCSDIQRCTNGEAGSNCGSNEDCKTGKQICLSDGPGGNMELCTDGELDSPCNWITDCNSNFCLSGACKENNYCESNQDCSGSYEFPYCNIRGGFCTDNTAQIGCTSNNDCVPFGFSFCSTVDSVCTAGITGVDTCANNNECAEGYCSGAQAYVAFICTNGNLGSPCEDDSRCIPSLKCDSGESNTCINR